MECNYISRGVHSVRVRVRLLAIVRVRLRGITVLFCVCACVLSLRDFFFVLTCMTRFGVLVFALCTKTP